MRASIFLLTLIGVPAMAQPGPMRTPPYSCELPAPDSVDMTGDGIPDLVVRGIRGVSTCDKPVSYGACAVVVQNLPGTQLLSERLLMGGREVRGFLPGDTIPALNVGLLDDLRIPRFAFIDGAVDALTWSYGRNGTTLPRMAPGTDRVFVFATTTDEGTTYGAFTLESVRGKRSVRIRAGSLRVGDEPVIVP